MTIGRRSREIRRKVSRALRPGRLATGVLLLAALGTAVWLLVLVVSENAVGDKGTSAAAPPSTSGPAPGASKTSVPSTTVAPTTTPTTAPPTQRSVEPTVPLGVYAGPGAPGAAATFAADAGAPVPYAFDYLDWSTWQTLTDPMWFLQHWNGSGFQMIWGVPMLPKTGATLAAGAAGQYNAYFSQLGYLLVANGQANSILLLGWDPEDSSQPWGANTPAQAADYIAYWRQIVTTMRAVPDEQFQFAWDSAPGANTELPPDLYPGNQYVDVIATDAFDKGDASEGSAGSDWANLAQAPYGLNWFAGFAERHHRPLMIAKWGVVPTVDSGGGDNATFVSDFLRWADRQHLLTAITWDYGSWAVTGGDFPRAASTLRAVASAGAVAPLARGIDS